MEQLDLMKEELGNKSLELKSLDESKSVLFVVDMVNGFVNEGALASSRVKEMVPHLVDTLSKTDMQRIYFIDQHEEDSVEFNAYPTHCVIATKESEIIEELEVTSNDLLIPKNSTNGFHAPLFKEWLNNNENDYDNYIITGCVTDICVLQFALTLRSYFNQMNRNKRVIVISSNVQTYSYGAHDGDLMHLFALYNMKINGIEVVTKLD